MLPFYRFLHLSHKHTLVHAVSQKESAQAYGFSLALHTGEEKEEIVTNRHRLLQELAVDEKVVVVTANQTHSDHVSVIEEQEMRGWNGREDAVEDCDALVTNQRGVIVAILTADCVPILLYDPGQNVVAAVHAGWRGTEAGIVVKTIRVMQEVFGTDPSHLLAGVAPAIGSCCYEVGEDVASHFSAYPDALEQHGEKYQLDLPQINREQMVAAGVKETQIGMSGICTSCDVAHYFSSRKEQGCSGRFMSLIGMR